MLQKAIVYMAVEAHVNPVSPIARELDQTQLASQLFFFLLFPPSFRPILQDGSEKPCSAPFHLVGPPHVCDSKPRQANSSSETSAPASPTQVQSPSDPRPRQKLTPEPPASKPSRFASVAAQTDTFDGRPCVSNGKAASSASIRGSSNDSHPVASSSKQKLEGPNATDSADASSSNPTSKRKMSNAAASAAAAVDGPLPSASNHKKQKTSAARTNGAHSPAEEAEEQQEGEDAAQPPPPAPAQTTHISQLRGAAKRSAAAAALRNGGVAPVKSKNKKGKGSSRRATADPAPSLSPALDEDGNETTPTSRKAGRKSASAAVPPVSSGPRAELTGKAQGKGIATKDVVSLSGHRADVYVSAWNPTVPDLIASGAGDATVRIWNLPPTGQTAEGPAICKHLPTTHTKDIASLDWNSDGTLLASGSHDGILRLWTPQGELHLVMSMHQGPILGVRWNRKGTMLLTGSGDGTAIVWDLGSGKVRQQYPIHSDSVLDIDWLVSKRVKGPSSTRHELIFATASADNSINLCRLGEAKPIKTIRGHEDEVNAIRFDASQRLLASASDDKTAKIWAIDPNALSGAAPDASATRSAKRSSAGLPSSTSSSMEIDENEDRHSKRASSTASGGMGDLGENGGSSSSHNDKNATASSTANGCVATLRGHTKEIYSLEWAPSGPGSAHPDKPRMLATCSYDKTARVWDVDSGQCIQTLEDHSEAVFAICWSPDASILVTGGTDKRVFLTRVSDGAILKAYVAGDTVFDVTWHSVADGAQSSTADGAADAVVKAEDGGSTEQQASLNDTHHRLAISSADRTLTVLELGTLRDLHAGVQNGGDREVAMKE